MAIDKYSIEQNRIEQNRESERNEFDDHVATGLLTVLLVVYIPAGKFLQTSSTTLGDPPQT